MIVEKVNSGITLKSKLAGAFIAGYMVSSIWHHTGVTDRAAEVLPTVAAQAGCEEWRANKNGALALGDQVVDKSQLAADKCPHPKLPPTK